MLKPIIAVLLSMVVPDTELNSSLLLTTKRMSKCQRGRRKKEDSIGIVSVSAVKACTIFVQCFDK